MASSKDINVKINVDSSQVDAAKVKIGELKSIDKTQVKIQYDINGKPIDVVLDKTLNLKKQVVELTKALRNTKEGTAEFTILKNRLNDTQDNLDRVNAKSKEFFGTLSLLPGPIGAISGQLQGAVDLLKIFSGFSLRDIGNQIKGLGNDIGDIVKNFLGLNSVSKNISIPSATAGGTVAGAGAAQVGASVGGTAVATSGGVAAASEEESKAIEKLVAQNGKLVSAREAAIKAAQSSGQSIANMTEAEVAQYMALRRTQTQQIANTQSTEALTAATEAETVATEAATVATSTFGKVLKAVFTATVILAVVEAIIMAFEWLTKLSEAEQTFKEEQEAASKAVGDFEVNLKNVQNTILEAKNGLVSKKEALKEYNDKLGKTIGYANSLDEAEKLMAANTPIVVESIKLRAEAQYLYGKAAEATGKIISGEAGQLGFWEKAWAVLNPFSSKAEAAAEKIDKLRQNSLDWGKEADKLTLKAIENDKKLQGQRMVSPEQAKEDADKAYNRRLKELDALITLEIDKEKTKQSVLIQLMDEKRAKIIKHDKLTYAEAEVLRNEDRKKLQQALTEDATRTIDFEIDKQNRLLSTVKQGSKEYYKYKTDLAKAEFDKEMELAKLDDKTRTDKELNARSNYNKKLKDLEEENFKQQEAWTAKQIELKNGLIRKDEERQIAARKEKLRQDEITLKNDINFIQSSEEKKKELRKQLQDAAEVDIRKIQLDANLKRKDDELKFLQLRQEGLIEGTMSYFKAQEDIINKSQERDMAALDKKAYEELMKTEDVEKEKSKIIQKYAEQRRQLLLKEIDTYLGYVNSGLGVISGFYSQQLTINGLAMDNELKKVAGNAEEEDKIKEKYFYKNRDAQKGQAIIATLQSAVQAYSALAGIPIVGPVLGAAAAAAALIFGYKQVDLIGQQTYQSSLTGNAGASKPALANYGKNYGDGGMIEGPLHSSPQGGVPIMAEGGEAVMTRGAVTMFRPLLSALNQMGGGTSFTKGAIGQANYDNPKIKDNAPQVIKTYIVENELTTIQHKQARLKDLSTL